MKSRRQSISIVVADDHPMVLHGITDVLRSTTDLNVVAECEDGAAAIEAIRRFAPDVAVLDMAMPKLDGLAVISSVVAERLATKIVILTATGTNNQILRAIALGAKGVIFKDANTRDFLRCVRTVAAGEDWLPPAIIESAREREAGRQLTREVLTKTLTLRERQVLQLVANGLPNKEVGRRLNLSDGTVKIHLHNIYKKVGVANRTALTILTMTTFDQLDELVNMDA